MRLTYSWIDRDVKMTKIQKRFMYTNLLESFLHILITEHYVIKPVWILQFSSLLITSLSAYAFENQPNTATVKWQFLNGTYWIRLLLVYFHWIIQYKYNIDMNAKHQRDVQLYLNNAIQYNVKLRKTHWLHNTRRST